MKGTIIIEIEDDSQWDLQDRLTKYEKIFRLLIDKGALDGVRGGSANLHFNGEGQFAGLELNYWPWKEKKVIHS